MPQHLVVSGCAAPPHRKDSRKLHQLPDNEMMDALRDDDGSPPEVLAHRELMELVLPMIRADFQLIETYTFRPGRPLHLPLTVLNGDQDTLSMTRQGLQWQKESSGPLTAHQFSGGHFFINAERDAVLACLKAVLMARETVPDPA